MMGPFSLQAWRLPAGVAFVLFALHLVVSVAHADESTLDYAGYIVQLRVGNGAVWLRRANRQINVITRMTLLTGDDLSVSGNAWALMQFPGSRQIVLNAARPNYHVQAETASPPKGTFDLMSEAVRSLLEKPPSGAAHAESKGSSDCAPDSANELPETIDMQPVAVLESELQVLPQHLRRVSTAWMGGKPPYLVRVKVLGGAAESDVGTYCTSSVDEVDLDSTGRVNDISLMVTDSRRQTVHWRLRFLPESTFRERLDVKGSAAIDDPLALAILALSSPDKSLHLAGATMMNNLADKYFVAWRLSRGVKDNEIGRR